MLEKYTNLNGTDLELKKNESFQGIFILEQDKSQDLSSVTTVDIGYIRIFWKRTYQDFDSEFAFTSSAGFLPVSTEKLVVKIKSQVPVIISQWKVFEINFTITNE